MWINKNGQLIQTVDTSRTKFKTTISDVLLSELQQQADSHNTNISFLLETGYVKLLERNTIQFDKKSRPKDRRDFRSTCDSELLDALKIFAKANKLNLNDVMEAAAKLVEPEKAKKENWRYRIERQ